MLPPDIAVTDGEAGRNPIGEDRGQAITRRQHLRDDPHPRRHLLFGWCAWLAAGCLFLYLLDFAALHAPVTADGATALLEGQTISGGNLALHGWSLSLDSFWGIDAFFYGLVVRVVGVRTDLLHFVPALLALLVVWCGIALARDERRGVGAIVATLVVIAWLGFPNPDLSYYLLQGPWHIGTALYCLLAFRALGRDHFGWEWAVAVALLAVGLLSDLLILTFGVLPCFAAGLIAMTRCRQWRAGLTATSASLASIAVAFALRQVLSAFGTFAIVNRNLVIKGTQLRANVGHLANRVPGLFGAVNIPVGRLSNGPDIDRALYCIGFVIVLVTLAVLVVLMVHGLFFGTKRLRGVSTRSWRIDDLLLLGIIADLATFVTSSANGHVEFVKYLTPGVIFAVILSARAIGRFVDRQRSPKVKGAVAAFAVAMTGIFAGLFVSNLSGGLPAQPAQPVANYLLAHGLIHGVGDYPTSSLITVDTGGKVSVRPVALSGAALARFNRQTTTAWYSTTRFRFLVYNSANPWHGVNLRSATATFGPPTKIVRLGNYRVLEWNRPFAVSLGNPTYGSPLNIHW